eukprot:GFKZ01006550.1.p1 GENE.GFKZ01006550.1~~GFKZ01006550.1.p1  ORF type:complete len:470 (+),score=59.02 GFKZ01006550.1:85-1410(+)
MQQSFITSACSPTTPFPLNNLPYGIFSRNSTVDSTPAVCVAIGDHVLDLSSLSSLFPQIFTGPHLPAPTAHSVFSTPSLNAFLALGKPAWLEARAALQDALSISPQRCPDLKNATAEQHAELLPLHQHVTMHLPAEIRDYTDFYSSKQHATNVGTMFRGPENALPPNWLHMPIAYHGRASSVVKSGTAIRRPCGQLRPDPASPPSFGPCRLLDFELEMAALIGGPANQLGDRVRVEHAGDRVFGFTLMNDWSARDIQKWEYVPLGPFGAKNFATTISPWVVTLEALEPFRKPPQEQVPQILDYLKAGPDVRGHCTYDIHLEVLLQTEAKETPSKICTSNFCNLYWTVAQQLAHHSVTGCNMQPGDLVASGTISGTESSSFGSMLELSWKGSKKIELVNSKAAEKRTFLQDGDTVYLRGEAKGDGFVVGFGECSGQILPAFG